MRKLILIVGIALSVEIVNGQQAEPLLFNEKIYDFREITEEAGAADHEFVFTNNSGRPVKIISVQASCGCTTPGWTQEPIPHGNKGVVKASFDPRGRPGYFNKSLTVTTDLDGNPITLQIQGQVVNAKSGKKADDFPNARGNLKLKTNSFNQGRIFINKDPVAREFPVFNASEKPIMIIKVTGPPYIKVETPTELKPSEVATVKISYDARLRSMYGFVSDNIEIETDDESIPLKSFSVYATLEEYFPTLNPEELARAPALRLQLREVDFGRLREGIDGLKVIKIKNTGMKELLIRSLQPNCTCITAAMDQLKIQPGEEFHLRISISTQGRKGTQQKALTIYSNDPVNPVQRITLMAYIE